MQSESFEGSTSNVLPIDASTKLHFKKKVVVGENSRGRVYGTTYLATNFRHSASSLTQASILASSIDRDDQLVENAQLRQQIFEAIEKAN